MSMEEENKMVDPGSEAAAHPSTERRRPRLNLGGALGGGDRKRGKSMFGLVLGTLNKAKIEDKERNASEAAKKRQMIEKRLQMKLRKETDSVRRAEEAKKEKSLANRKEEELQLKDSMFKLRRKRLPLLANFLCTSDEIPSDPTSASTNSLSAPSRSHPPPLYFLPAILTPAQQVFLDKRRAEVNEAAEKEWQEFRQEREAGIQEIAQLRQKVADEETRQKQERDAMDTDDAPPVEKGGASPAPADKPQEASHSADMDVDDSTSKPSSSKPEPEKSDPEPSDKKDEIEPIQADDDDAVEY